MKLFKAIGLGFVGLGVVLLVIGLFVYRHTQRFIDHSLVTTGAVIKLTSEWADDGQRVYYPVIAFTTDVGEPVEFRANVGSSSQPYAVGDTISVRYDPAQPTSAGINSTMGLWFGFGILLLLGCAFLGMGAGALYAAIRFPERITLRVNNSGRQVTVS